MGMTRNGLFFIVAVAIVAALPMFIVTEPLWDDFTLCKQSYEGIKEHFVDNGYHRVGFSFFHYGIAMLPNAFLWVKMISVLLTTAIAILFARILMKLKVANETSVMIVMTLFLTLPFFTYRFSQIALPNLFALIAFVGGILMLITYFQKEQNLYFLISVPLIFISFVISSLLVLFYAVLLLVIIFYRDTFLRSKVKIGILVLMPIVAFMLSQYLLKPSGLHAITGYNQITMKSLILTAPINSLADLYRIPYSFVLSLRDLFSFTGNIIVFIILFVLVFVLVTMLRKKWNFAPASVSPLFIIGGGVFLILAAVYPYEVVSNSTTSFFYNSRNQVLVPFGASLALFGVLQLIFSRSEKFFAFIFSLLITVNLVISLHIYAQYYNNTILQKSFFVHWKQHEAAIPENMILLDVDNIKFQTLQRWNFYEIGGLLRLNGMKTDRLISDLVLAKDLKKMGVEHMAMKMYNTDEFDASAISERTVSIHFKNNMLSISDAAMSIVRNDLKNEESLAGLIDIKF